MSVVTQDLASRGSEVADGITATFLVNLGQPGGRYRFDGMREKVTGSSWGGTKIFPAGQELSVYCEAAFAYYTSDDCDNGAYCRSMSVGDVVVVGEAAFVCESVGFRRLDRCLAFMVPASPDDLKAI